MTLLALGVAAARPAPAQAREGCTRSRPQYGTLRLDRPGQIRVNRNGAPLSLGGGDLICAGDRIPASAASGMIVGAAGTSIPIVPGREIVVPGRRVALVEWLLSPLFRSYWFDRAGTTAGSSMSVGESGFALRGMADGSATIDSGRDTLVVPVRRSTLPQRLELWAPGGREPVAVATVAPGERDAIFRRIPSRPGLWRVVPGEPDALIGGFRMRRRGGDDPLPRELRDLRLPDRERALASACFDPVVNGLEAYQGLSEADRSRVIAWQVPTDELGCTAPGTD